jgi:hypothetical protein
MPTPYRYSRSSRGCRTRPRGKRPSRLGTYRVSRSTCRIGRSALFSFRFPACCLQLDVTLSQPSLTGRIRHIKDSERPSSIPFEEISHEGHHRNYRTAGDILDLFPHIQLLASKKQCSRRHTLRPAARLSVVLCLVHRLHCRHWSRAVWPLWCRGRDGHAPSVAISSCRTYHAASR